MNGVNPVVRKVFDKVTWFTSTARNAIITVICLGIAYFIDSDVDWDEPDTTFKLTGEIPVGLPNVTVPDFVIEIDGHEEDFGGILSTLGSALIIIPIIAILENIAIGKAFGMESTI